MQREVNLIITDAYRLRFPNLAFGIGAIQEEQVSNGIKLAIEILGKFGNGKESWWKVFKPEEA